jgi:hypothetical protein
MKILFSPSTASLEKYTYSIIHHLFQMEKILTSSIATPETKIFHHVPPLLFVENTNTSLCTSQRNQKSELMEMARQSTYKLHNTPSHV